MYDACAAGENFENETKHLHLSTALLMSPGIDVLCLQGSTQFFLVQTCDSKTHMQDEFRGENAWMAGGEFAVKTHKTDLEKTPLKTATKYDHFGTNFQSIINFVLRERFC